MLLTIPKAVATFDWLHYVREFGVSTVVIVAISYCLENDFMRNSRRHCELLQLRKTA